MAVFETSKCKKCNTTLGTDKYTVCKSCRHVERYKEMNPINLLDENKVDILLKLLLEEDKRNDRKLEKDFIELFTLVLKTKISYKAGHIA